MYDSFKQWVDHEITVHGVSLSCSEHGIPNFASVSKYREHMAKVHQKEPTVTVLGRRHCPICLQATVDFKHVGLHLQQIALFSLPRSTGLESDSERGSHGSERGNHGSERGSHGSERGSLGSERGSLGSEHANLESVITEPYFSDVSEPSQLLEDRSPSIDPIDPSETGGGTDEQWVDMFPKLRRNDKPYTVNDTGKGSKFLLTEEAVAHVNLQSRIDPVRSIDDFLQYSDRQKVVHERWRSAFREVQKMVRINKSMVPIENSFYKRVKALVISWGESIYDGNTKLEVGWDRDAYEMVMTDCVGRRILSIT